MIVPQEHLIKSDVPITYPRTRRLHTMSDYNKLRRYFFRAAGAMGLGLFASQARAHHTESHLDDFSPHKLVYQLNKADPDYIEHILFSCGEMLRKYGDEVELVIAMFGPGIHLVGKKPGRPVSPAHQTRAKSLADYGVAFHTCGNTMKTVGWTRKDLFEFASVVPVGVDDVMLLQEKGFSYISW